MKNVTAQDIGVDANGRQQSVRDLLKQREAREELRQRVSDASKERSYRMTNIERRNKLPHFVHVRFNRAQALCLFDLLMTKDVGAEATVVGSDSQGVIELAIDTRAYRLYVGGGVELLPLEEGLIDIGPDTTAL